MRLVSNTFNSMWLTGARVDIRRRKLYAQVQVRDGAREQNLESFMCLYQMLWGHLVRQAQNLELTTRGCW